MLSAFTFPLKTNHLLGSAPVPLALIEFLLRDGLLSIQVPRDLDLRRGKDGMPVNAMDHRTINRWEVGAIR